MIIDNKLAGATEEHCFMEIAPITHITVTTDAVRYGFGHTPFHYTEEHIYPVEDLGEKL